MQIKTITHRSIANPIYTKLSADASISAYSEGDALAPGDFLVIDAGSCSPDEIGLAFAPLDMGASVLLLDPSDEHKQALAKNIGFCSHGASRGYHVVKQTNANGHSRYCISEAGESKSLVTSISQCGNGDADGPKETFPPQVAYQDVEQVQALTDDEIDRFVASLTTTTELEETSNPPPAGLVWYTWIYSKSHSFTASGSENTKYNIGPPPSQTISTYLTYVFQGALNNSTQSGDFQFLGLQETGIFQNNGMSSSSDTSFGWVLGAISPAFVPPSSLAWYQSSPSNTNDVTQVTTGSSVTVGFNAGTSGAGGNASYTYSNSTTNNITDWYIKQQTASNWIYAQNTPYDGYTTDGDVISDCINWYSGHINTSSFPTISTSSLQFAVDTIWKTNSVLTGGVTISISNLMRVDYIMTGSAFLGLNFSWADWWYTSTPTDTFTIDMSVLS